MLLRFDRSNLLRRDEAQLRRLLRAVPQALFLPVSSDLKVPVSLPPREATDKREARLKWVGKDEAAAIAPGLVSNEDNWPNAIFLGMGEMRDTAEQCPLFAVDTNKASQEQASVPGVKWLDGRSALGTLTSEIEQSTMSMARALIHFHSSSSFCPGCGRPTVMKTGGTSRECVVCNKAIYPRIDPVVISLVHKNDQCLVARQPQFPANYYSCLAGFIEPGETIAEGLAREVHEEVGVRIEQSSLRVLSSQSWPFPSSLMIGCEVATLDEALTIDRTELEDAKWISRTELLRAFQAQTPQRLKGIMNQTNSSVSSSSALGDIQVPPHFTIAHQLLRTWATRKTTV